MILLVSDQFDQSTNDLIDWGHYYGQEVLVITNEDKVYLIDIEIANSYFSISVNKKIINSNDVKYFIYRKGDINLLIDLKNLDNKTSQEVEFLEKELIIIKNYIFLALQTQTKKYFGDYFKRYPNELNYLNIANSVGLKIPETIITPSKVKLSDLIFSKKHSTSLCFCC
ncbi:MAG: hypothetical protein R6V37_04170 [Psychroflexus maritimus]